MDIAPPPLPLPFRLPPFDVCKIAELRRLSVCTYSGCICASVCVHIYRYTAMGTLLEAEADEAERAGDAELHAAAALAAAEK